MSTLTITKKELLSPTSIHAMKMCEYRHRHNMRYAQWTEEKRLSNQLEHAFDAIIAERKS